MARPKKHDGILYQRGGVNGHTQDGETVSRSTHVHGRRPQALAKARAPRRTAGLEAAGAPPHSADDYHAFHEDAKPGVDPQE